MHVAFVIRLKVNEAHVQDMNIPKAQNTYDDVATVYFHMMPRPKVLLLLPLGLVACKRDRQVVSQNPANWTVSSVSGLLQPGSTDTVHFVAALDSGWYIYSLTQKPGGPTPMSVTLAPSPPYTLVGDVIGPKPVVIFDKEFGINSERYTGNPAFTAIVAIPPGSRARASLDLKVRYQACNATLCLPARTTTLTTPVRVAKP